ncbi:immunoglobulin superfamily, member 1 [Chelydra serpentina]|nr:immunoglobulin superfamily, member 1 [Chelydra serpentina]
MAVGGALTIQCKCRCQGMRVVLYKGGGPTPLRYMDNAGDVVEFPISNVTLNDVGSYTCRSGSTSAPSIWSDPSDPIELVMRELYPKPSISVSPRRVMAMGGTVTIRCECRYQGLRVVLYKGGDHTALQHIESTGDVTEFPIGNVTQGDSRSYTCPYGSTSQAFIWSDPSDPVELVGRGEGPGLEFPPSAQHPAQPSQGLCPKGMLRARINPGDLQRGCPARDQEISGFVMQPGKEQQQLLM